MATTSDPMRWRGRSAEHVCWRRSAVRWAWGRSAAPQRPRQVRANQVRPCACGRWVGLPLVLRLASLFSTASPPAGRRAGFGWFPPGLPCLGVGCLGLILSSSRRRNTESLLGPTRSNSSCLLGGVGVASRIARIAPVGNLGALCPYAAARSRPPLPPSDTASV
jgi:hypothetical protein